MSTLSNGPDRNSETGSAFDQLHQPVIQQSDGAMSLPTFTLDQIAAQLTDDYWEFKGDTRRAFDTENSNLLTVDISGLTEDGQALAQRALTEWSNVADLDFAFVSGGAQITFSNESNDVSTTSEVNGGKILSSEINIPQSFLETHGTEIPGFGYFTFLQQIGQALGLGHAGNYGDAAAYGQDNHYANDSWQSSVMSAFSQTDNTSIDASFAYPVTPMIADILAAQNLYGAPDDTYLEYTIFGANIYGDYNEQGFVEISPEATATIYDSQGNDLIRFLGYEGDQRIDLNEEATSDFAGGKGNLTIARGTVIERAYGGNGDDVILGNSADNHLGGYGGDDILIGGEGDDFLSGRTGADLMLGGPGDDTILGESGDIFFQNGVPVDLGGSGYDRLIISLDSSFQTDSLSQFGIEHFWGGGGDDKAIGDDPSVNYILEGRYGNDVLTGSDGDDTLLGGTGHDILTGGAGNDLVRGGIWGYDQLFGQEGDDTIYYASGKVFWDDHKPRDIGGAGFDTLLIEDGSKFNTVGLSWYGFEAFVGAEKNDRVYGNDATVDYRLDGGGGNDDLRGSGGDDQLFGRDGTDILFGKAGDDVLDPGASTVGEQLLFGGEGNDTYRISSDNGRTYVEELLAEGADNLVFDDLTPAEIDASIVNGTDLLLTWDNGTGQVTINDLGNQVERYEFADGSVYSAGDFELP
ncbi:M10 family metallopeptidase [uncultured Roseibium sp.]|uniref:M10 family metallopeptidase n=1 Tax=uncultured Roseibium sp. TaxID=1936171 RepID=UPI002638B6DC|nr:M10 family metallopeptidase [uncultured Roseibium sp.]